MQNKDHLLCASAAIALGLVTYALVTFPYESTVSRFVVDVVADAETKGFAATGRLIPTETLKSFSGLFAKDVAAMAPVVP